MCVIFETVSWVAGGGNGSTEDLDAFLDRLLASARPVKAAKAGQVNAPEAARLAFCMSEEIVRLILDGKLARKWRLAGERGYMSVLIDVEEVRALVRGPDHGGLTGVEIKDRLATTTKVAAALIRHGHLKTITVVNPVNRCPTVVVPAEEVERFGKQSTSPKIGLGRQLQNCSSQQVCSGPVQSLDSRLAAAELKMRFPLNYSKTGIRWLLLRRRSSGGRRR